MNNWDIVESNHDGHLKASEFEAYIVYDRNGVKVADVPPPDESGQPAEENGV